MSLIFSFAVCQSNISSDVDSRNPLKWSDQVARAVMLCALLYKKDISRLIEFGVDVNARLIEGNTFLIIAVVKRQTESVKALVHGGADINAQQDDGISPLHLASCLGFADIVTILLDHGADIESRDIKGRTALFTVVHFDITVFLVVAMLIVHDAGVVDTLLIAQAAGVDIREI